MTFLKSRYYPVDVTNKLIYDDPQKRESDCSLNSDKYKGFGTIGIKGERLNRFDCYKSFRVTTVQTMPQTIRIKLFETSEPETYNLLGQGAYPYECRAKDKHPDSFIYRCVSGGWIPSHDLRHLSGDLYQVIWKS